MKKIAYFIASIILMTGCTDKIISEINDSNAVLDEKIEQIRKKLEQLEKLCESLNNAVVSLQRLAQAVQENDFVQKITPLTDDDGKIIGYCISMLKGGDVNVFNGVDGKYPDISIKKDEADGEYYWTLDGEWLLTDDGNRIVAQAHDGTTPKFKIEDGFWFLSVDGGISWEKLDESKGRDGHSFFSAIDLAEDMLRLTLVDGTVISIPRYVNPEIEFNIEGDTIGAASGVDVYIRYSIKSKTDGIILTAASDGNYAVKVIAATETTGQIVVTPPSEYCDGFINVILSDKYGFSTVRVINFSENKIVFAEGYEYQIPSNGGHFSIPFQCNFDCDIVSDRNWIKIVPETKAEMSDHTIELDIDRNEELVARSGRINVYSKNNHTQPYATIVINQASAVFSISQTLYAVKWDGDHLKADIYSTLGLVPESLAEWISVRTSMTAENEYELTISVASNSTKERRSGYVYLNDASGRRRLGVIEVMQDTEHSDESDDMIMIVRANYPNDFTAELPLWGSVDCFVEWGDGHIEHYVSGPVSHKYETTSPESYEVRVFGTVTALNSNYIKTPSIVEVKQWGRTGLRNMQYAFRGQTLLEKIAGNSTDAFKYVDSFQEAFNSCYRLKEIPDNFLAGASRAVNFQNTFSSCILIKNIHSEMFKDCIMMKDASNIFSDCTSIEHIPDGLFKNLTELDGLPGAFHGCTNLATIGKGVFINAKSLKNISSIFSGCSSLKSIPADIFDTNLNLTYINEAFYHCVSLEGESPYSIIDGRKYHLYERDLLPDRFQLILDMRRLFGYGAWEGLADKDQIPEVCK